MNPSIFDHRCSDDHENNSNIFVGKPIKVKFSSIIAVRSLGIHGGSCRTATGGDSGEEEESAAVPGAASPSPAAQQVTEEPRASEDSLSFPAPQNVFTLACMSHRPADATQLLVCSWSQFISECSSCCFLAK